MQSERCEIEERFSTSCPIETILSDPERAGSMLDGYQLSLRSEEISCDLLKGGLRVRSIKP